MRFTKLVLCIICAIVCVPTSANSKSHPSYEENSPKTWEQVADNIYMRTDEDGKWTLYTEEFGIGRTMNEAQRLAHINMEQNIMPKMFIVIGTLGGQVFSHVSAVKNSDNENVIEELDAVTERQISTKEQESWRLIDGIYHYSIKLWVESLK